MSRTSLLHTSTVIAAMMVAMCIFARLSFAQVTGGVITVANTGNATNRQCLFDATGVNATFASVSCPALTAMNMAACITAIDNVQASGMNVTEAAVPVLLNVTATAGSDLAGEGTMAGNVVSMSGASGVSVAITFTSIVPATNIASAVTYAEAFSTALNASENNTYYFSVDSPAASCVTASPLPAGTYYIAAGDDAMTLSVELAGANTTGIRFVKGFPAETARPAAAALCGFAATNSTIAGDAPSGFTGDCEEVAVATYTTVDVPTGVAPAVQASGGGDDGDGTTGLWSFGLVGAILVSLVALVL